MKALAVCVFILLASSCRDPRPTNREQPQLVQEATGAGAEAIRDAALPQLPAARAAFWAQWVGRRPGEPGPRFVAWCDDRDGADRFIVENAMSVAHERQSDTCTLAVWSAELRAEARIALSVWNGKPWYDGAAYGTWIDEPGKWSARIDDAEGGPLVVGWHRHVAFEEVLGTDGRLLRDLDVESLVGKPASALRAATRPPFVIARCDSDSCTANGPHLPGGEAVSVFMYDVPKGLGVTIGTMDPRNVHMRIAQSLGPEDPGARNTTGRDLHVHRRGNVRYEITRYPQSVSILLSPERASGPEAR